jgi:DNA-binding NarL/FixJ family response regulator
MLCSRREALTMASKKIKRPIAINRSTKSLSSPVSLPTGPQKRPLSKRSTILVVDDHPAIREGLTSAINETDDLVVCGAAESALQAMAEIARLQPDAVVIDIGLHNSNGVELMKDIRAGYSGKIPVLVLSMHDEALYAERIVHAGARGYVMKKEPMKTVIEALRKILNGGIYLSNEMSTIIIGSIAKYGEPRPLIESLSDRELQVFELIGEGHGTGEIADLLHLNTKTVSCYRQNIRAKLGLKNAAELGQHAVHWAATQNIAPASRDSSEAKADVTDEELG